jgi:SAM-dependent methyltransferase
VPGLNIIDKVLLRRRLAGAYKRPRPGADFLVDAAAADLLERLAAVERHFPLAVVLFGQTPALAAGLRQSGKAGAVFALERVEAAARQAGAPAAVADEEQLPLAQASVDLVASALALHWTNDLPGALVQIRRALRPDGLFLASLLGGGTLAELRHAFAAAEVELTGGAAPRILPFADVRDIGALLQRAGFALPVTDRDVLTVRYASVFGLFADLKAMGATSVLAERARRPASRRLLARTADIYAERFADPDGRLRATFEVVSLAGWAPHESQQKPARRGSAQVSLADILRPGGSGSADGTP